MQQRCSRWMKKKWGKEKEYNKYWREVDEERKNLKKNNWKEILEEEKRKFEYNDDWKH